MGKLARGLGDDQRSIEYHSEALKLNPFMWDGFVDMCNTGIHTEETFVLLHGLIQSRRQLENLEHFPATPRTCYSHADLPI